MKPNGRGRIFVSGVVFFLIVSILARFLYDVHDLLHMAVTSSFCRAFLSVLIGWFGLIGLMIAVVVPFLGTRCIDPILREHFFGANGHLNELTYAACFLFRAPHGPNLLMICNNMLARDNNHQTTLAYVERIVDRIINKGRGMLTFNAGLIALSTALFKLSTGDGNPGSLAKQIGSASFASATAPSHPVMIALQTVVLIDLCISSILMLEMFVVRWGPAESYKDAAKECSYALLLCRDRSIIMNFAIFLSAICVFGLLDEVIPYPTN